MRYEDLTGRRFGRLVVVTRAVQPIFDGKTQGGWTCMCDCGTEKWVPAGNLTNGSVKSCGCIRKESRHAAKDPIYNTWNTIRHRILNPHYKDYGNYGGRGLTIDPEWVNDFFAFREWVLQNLGAKPSAAHTLDRAENSVGYLKGNLRWATPETQANNRRSNRLITRDGETLTLKQWCIRLGLNYGAVKMRVNAMAWPVEVALTIPTDGTRVHKLTQYIQESSHATA